MQPRTKAALFDIAHAAVGIAQFVEGKTIDDYQGDPMLRSAVERQFTIIGEAVNRLCKDDPATAKQITEYDRIISFRNVLVHGYDHLDDQTTWKIIRDKLPILTREVEALLKAE
jgi:uncharacterized protein with HEPN domain